MTQAELIEAMSISQAKIAAENKKMGELITKLQHLEKKNQKS